MAWLKQHMFIFHLQSKSRYFLQNNL
jgi:hypothetical protein